MGFSARASEFGNKLIYNNIIKRPVMQEAVIIAGEKLRKVVPAWKPGFTCAKITLERSMIKNELDYAVMTLGNLGAKGESLLLAHPKVLSQYPNTIRSMEHYKQELLKFRNKGVKMPENLIASCLKKGISPDLMLKLIEEIPDIKNAQKCLLAALNTDMTYIQIRALFKNIDTFIPDKHGPFYLVLEDSLNRFNNWNGEDIFQLHSRIVTHCQIESAYLLGMVVPDMIDAEMHPDNITSIFISFRSYCPKNFNEAVGAFSDAFKQSYNDLQTPYVFSETIKMIAERFREKTPLALNKLRGVLDIYWKNDHMTVDANKIIEILKTIV